ncbi:MAG: oligosaccharide flippase family protein [Candidatus Shapirobacteria bacterium]|nr:oligosaccharide flippase family protein [Candidatus Shapirobacteria bacterium]MDD3002451.1 oligosaccharide flippase family protein [Candidatus Shapirobacteria bacterium]MDD4383360.1 oligosaccharide flippase family protein [Candidatus Shapirobacteria bacterium]
MEEINLQEIKNKTTKNVLFLSLRNIGIQAISVIGFFLLTILLGVGEVGLFAIVAESVSILGYFSDLGLAAALIQKKDEVKKEELQTTFTIQQILVIISLIVTFFIFTEFSRNKSYGPQEFWIFISLCFSFICASLKTIPSVLLERKLNFKLISTVDIIENACFYGFAVLFAFLGFDVYSYAIATFIRSLLGLIIIYKYSFWPIGFSFNWESAKSLFKYGIPFQLNSFIAMAKDRLSNLLVAGIIGRTDFGILSWAQKGPRIPLSFMDAIMRVTFPTFARLQDHKEILKKSLEKSLYFIALVVFPMTVGIALIAPDIINLIPNYKKWSPAIFPLYFYAISVVIASITTPLTNAFNAIGKITLTTKFMIMWTVLTLFFYPLLSYKFGYTGTAYAVLIVSLSSFIVWFVAQKVFDIKIIKTISNPTIATILMIIPCLIFQSLNLSSLVNIIGKILISVLVYGFYTFLFSKDEIIWFWRQLSCLKTKK